MLVVFRLIVFCLVRFLLNSPLILLFKKYNLRASCSMPPKKAARLDFSVVVKELEENEETVSTYQNSLKRLNLGSIAVHRTLSVQQQFGLAVAKFGFHEVNRIYRALQQSKVSPFYKPSLVSELVKGDLELVSFLLTYLSSTGRSRPTTSSSTAASSSTSTISDNPSTTDVESWRQ